MKRTDADALYNTNWQKPFTTMEALFTQIKLLSENGCYTVCIAIDSKAVYNAVFKELRDLGYEVSEYNTAGSGIMEIVWG